MEGKNIVMAITSLNTDDTRNFIRQSISWIKRFNGKRKPTVVALYVIDKSLVDIYSVGGDYFDMHGMIKEISAKAKEDGEKILADVKAEYGKDLNIVTKVKIGNPVREIVNEARSYGANTILLGASKLASLRKALLGSVVQGVVSAAPCPVVIITPQLIRLTEKVPVEAGRTTKLAG